VSGRRFLTVPLTLVLVCTVAAVVPAGAFAPRSASVRLQSSAPPPAPRGARLLGDLPADTRMSIDITLDLPHPARLTAFVAAVSDPRSPRYRQFLTKGQFARVFGPSWATVRSVERMLRHADLRPGVVSANRLVVSASGTARAVEHAFGTTIGRYRLPGGRLAFRNLSAPHVPPAVAGVVAGVVGLDDLAVPRDQFARSALPAVTTTTLTSRSRLADRERSAGPKPCSAAAAARISLGGFTANELAGFYAMTPLYSVGDFGQGVDVGLLELAANVPSDVTTYQHCYSTDTTIRTIPVDGGGSVSSGSAETVLDVEDLVGLVPRATIDVYDAPDSSVGWLDTYARMVADDDPVISTSWGLCELDAGSVLIQSVSQQLLQAAAQGETVVAATGDTGPTGCLRDPGTTNRSALSVVDPAAQPNVLAVGGTSIWFSSSAGERIWNGSSVGTGSGGGGVSSVWCMPSYQSEYGVLGVVNIDSTHDSLCSATGTVPYRREVPDVAADADPYTGYVMYYAAGGGWFPAGGTSAAAPLWAAVAALTDASPFCRYDHAGRPGTLPAGLYRLAGSHLPFSEPGFDPADGLYDVTAGGNDYTPSGYTGGLYHASAGYDMASGLGSPYVTEFDRNGNPSLFYPGIAALMCWAYRSPSLPTVRVTGVSPYAGPVDKAVNVTVSGSGFLPVRGADVVEVGTRWVAARCSSTTRCTVTLPAMSAGTVAIRMWVEDLSKSASTSYRVVPLPTVGKLSPRSGPAGGGNLVTVYGTNFVRVTAVRFGTVAGTSVRVLSPTELTVLAPAGSAAVHVRVVAAGGTSPADTASTYTY
jgi:subtilase family serine protease